MLSYGLLGGWRLDESISPRLDVLASRSLIENSGTVISVPGKISNAAKITSVAVTLVNTNGEILPRDRFTMACWVNLTSGTGNINCLTQSGASTRQIIGVNGTTNKAIFSVNGTIASEGIIITGRWTHIALTYDDSIPAYLSFQDGSVILQHNVQATFNAPSGVSIGVAGASCNVLIDEAYLWNRILNPSEISSLYTAGNAGLSYPWNDGKL